METTPTPAVPATIKPYRILTLDGGGAKGFYTLGVLNELEALLGRRPLCESFDLIFGTSTGAIIAAMLALGNKVKVIADHYTEHVPTIMSKKSAADKTAALRNLATTIFEDRDFTAFKTNVGIVTTNWTTEKPTIFKTDPRQAHGREATFVPGFGCSIAAAVVASCAAFPFFEKQIVPTNTGKTFTLADGGFCANNPALYALTDALGPLGRKPADIRLVSIGVGMYPPRERPLLHWSRFIKWCPDRWLVPQLPEMVQKTMEVNTRSMELLQQLLYPKTVLPTVRINGEFHEPHMATDFLEHDLTKLNMLYERGAESFGRHEADLRTLLL
jgi:predicted patatin/cPLA2 family phospholipase